MIGREHLRAGWSPPSGLAESLLNKALVGKPHLALPNDPADRLKEPEEQLERQEDPVGASLLAE